METIYTPGQILYIKSPMGPWYYISVLHYAKPVKHMDKTYEFHTCCDLCVDTDGSESLTFERSNSSLLDLLNIPFDEVREATEVEREYLYKALVRGFKDHDLGWDKHFTDSTYFDILDWLAWGFDVDLDANQNTPLGETINEIQKYIWDSLCRETGNDHTCTDYVEPEMVNKQEFMEKLEKWIRMNTDWLDEYIWDGRNPNYGLWDELKKFMEE